MKRIIALSALILLVACQDLKKSKQIQAISNMEKTLDSISEVFKNTKNDTIGQVFSSVMDVEFRIRRNYESDTIDREFGKKINAYKIIRKKINPIRKNYTKLEKGFIEEALALKNLKADVENSAGEKAKYDEYIKFEENKLKILMDIYSETYKEQEYCEQTYLALHPELYKFSMQLIKDKK